MEEFKEAVVFLFGAGDDLATWQMALRAMVVYPVALVMVKLGDKRFLGELAAFDFLLAIVIGSIVSRAISGTAPFWPSLAASLVLVLLHRGIAIAGLRWARLGDFVKGSHRVLVRDGKIHWDEMRSAGIGEADLVSALRRRGRLQDLSAVQLACLERNGEISVIPQTPGP